MPRGSTNFLEKISGLGNGNPSPRTIFPAQHNSISVANFFDATVLNSGCEDGDLFPWRVAVPLSSSCPRPGSVSCLVRSKMVFRCNIGFSINNLVLVVWGVCFGRNVWRTGSGCRVSDAPGGCSCRRGSSCGCSRGGSGSRTWHLWLVAYGSVGTSSGRQRLRVS